MRHVVEVRLEEVLKEWWVSLILWKPGINSWKDSGTMLTAELILEITKFINMPVWELFDFYSSGLRLEKIIIWLIKTGNFQGKGNKRKNRWERKSVKAVLNQEEGKIIMRKNKWWGRKRSGEMKDRYSSQRLKHGSLRFQRWDSAIQCVCFFKRGLVKTEWKSSRKFEARFFWTLKSSC